MLLADDWRCVLPIPKSERNTSEQQQQFVALISLEKPPYTMNERLRAPGCSSNNSGDLRCLCSDFGWPPCAIYLYCNYSLGEVLVALVEVVAAAAALDTLHKTHVQTGATEWSTVRMHA